MEATRQLRIDSRRCSTDSTVGGSRAADPFLEEQLQPQRLVAACEEVSFPLTYREHAEYDHSYYFIASFIDDHLRFHAKYLA